MGNKKKKNINIELEEQNLILEGNEEQQEIQFEVKSDNFEESENVVPFEIAQEKEELINDVKKRRSKVVVTKDTHPENGINLVEKQIESKENNTVVAQTIVVEDVNERLIKKSKKIEEKEKQKIAKDKKKTIKRQGPKIIVRYETDIENGLSNEIVQQRREDGLTNTTSQGSTKSIKKIFVSNIFTFFNFLTLAIAGWLISIAMFKDLIFLAIVTANVVLGIVQEIKAKKNIDKLSLISAPSAIVIRNGSQFEIGVSEVVLDDLLILENGKQICTDSIVVSGSIEVNESLLTGESDAILKKPGDILYSGSFVVSGYAKARVDKIGKENYIEKLTSQAKKYVKPKSDLWKSLNIIILVMTIIIVPVGGILFYMQFKVNTIGYALAVRKTAGAMVGMIPSGLYLVTSVALFVGVQRLTSFNVLVQELYCIEMLARVNVLCLDKTGTITDGTMSVQNVIEYDLIGGLSTKNVVSAMLNALADKNLTSVALEEKFGLGKRIKHSATIPFSSQRKYSAVTFEKYGTFVLGAPEFVLKNKFYTVESDVTKYAAEGYRVLIIAHTSAQIVDNELDQSNLNAVALILIEDNVRPDAIDTINYFKRSGVEVKVISGDNPLTVSKVSERAGIRNASKYISLDGLTDAEVIRAANKYTVFGRVSPVQKKLLVQTLKQEGNIVAMTGDGVNDILALKEADCSIAVASGSEAARNVSHLVLMDSNFGSMPKVVSEGRRVINNIAKVACLYLTKTIFSFLLAMQALNSGGAYPISTSQLFMIDFLCIGLPSFVLILEPNNAQVEGKFLYRIIRGALPGAIAILISSMIVFALQDALYMNFQTSSTIIVITATFTCMMVLFEVCRPFNFLRKTLCGFVFTMFVFLTLFMPKFFEFSPMLKVGDYYDQNAMIETYRDVPSIGISKADYYIIDGYITDYIATANSFSCSNKNGFLTINSIDTNYLLKTPDLVSSKNGLFVFGGYKTDILISAKVELFIESDGTVYLYSVEGEGESKIILEKHKTSYNVMPTVVKNPNGYFVINGEQTSIATNNKTTEKYIRNNKLYLNGKETD